jgi:hypothetical protein
VQQSTTQPTFLQLVPALKADAFKQVATPTQQPSRPNAAHAPTARFPTPNGIVSIRTTLTKKCDAWAIRKVMIERTGRDMKGSVATEELYRTVMTAFEVANKNLAGFEAQVQRIQRSGEFQAPPIQPPQQHREAFLVAIPTGMRSYGGNQFAQVQFRSPQARQLQQAYTADNSGFRIPYTGGYQAAPSRVEPVQAQYIQPGTQTPQARFMPVGSMIPGLHSASMQPYVYQQQQQTNWVQQFTRERQRVQSREPEALPRNVNIQASLFQ